MALKIIDWSEENEQKDNPLAPFDKGESTPHPTP